jgi:hypothetical protein
MQKERADIIPDTKLEDRIRRTAKNLSIFRRLERLADKGSDPWEMAMDWHNACIFWASQILDGTIPLCRLEEVSFRRLEEIWLKEVEELKAYYYWEKQSTEDGLWLPKGKKEEQYFVACKEVRQLLTDPSVKGNLSNFEKAEQYIIKKYLTEEGKLDEERARMEIHRKAARIWESTGYSNSGENWQGAKSYMRMFYENIIPAVRKNNPENILGVLRAFQYSNKAPENCSLIVNCFEAALAVYCINNKTIETLWDEFNKSPYPESATISTEVIESWPAAFEVPEECKDSFTFDVERSRIIFYGMMTNSQKSELLKKVTDPKHALIIEKLFQKSRLIHKETTL